MKKAANCIKSIRGWNFLNEQPANTRHHISAKLSNERHLFALWSELIQFNSYQLIRDKVFFERVNRGPLQLLNCLIYS